MADDKTLLAHLAPMLKSRDRKEDIAVLALGYILSTSEGAVRGLENVLKTGGVEVGAISPDVRTQASDEKGRPDLSCRDENGKERVLIEAKFQAQLTARQPVDYLKRLPPDRPSVLLFVVPTGRFELLWTELSRRVNADGVELLLEKKDTNLLSANVGGERRLMLTSWANLLNHMAVQVKAKKDSRAACDIRQLQGLALQDDKEAFLPLRAEELRSEFPRRVLGLQRLTQDAFERVCKSERVDCSGLRGNPPWSRYMRLAGAGATIGVYFDLWAQSRDTPLWLILDPWGDDATLKVRIEDVRRRLAPLRQEVPPGIIDRGRRLLVPINLPLGVEYDSVLDAVVERLEYIARLIDSPETTS